MYECGYYFLFIFQSFNDVLGNRYLFIISEEDGASVLSEHLQCNRSITEKYLSESTGT